MPKFLIKRQIPGVGEMSPEELRDASDKSNCILRELGPEIQWVHSYVSGDVLHCVYIASDENLVRTHAEKSGFPADHIMEVVTMIDPTTAESTRVAVA